MRRMKVVFLGLWPLAFGPWPLALGVGGVVPTICNADFDASWFLGELGLLVELGSGPIVAVVI